MPTTLASVESRTDALIDTSFVCKSKTDCLTHSRYKNDPNSADTFQMAVDPVTKAEA
jgi:hypothetical protein